MLAVTSRRKPVPPAAGLSLPELCTVLAIAAVLLAVAAPDLRDLVRTQQLKAATADLFAAIDFARARALARGRQVKLVPLDPLGADWRLGWRVLDDDDGGGSGGGAGAGGGTGTAGPVAEHGPLPPGIAVDFSFTNSARPYYIAYNGAGRSCADGDSAAARWGTVSLYHGGHIRRIKINMLGRARVCDPARDAGCDGAPAPP
ncbi:GspH/FimT family pseudopilin [Massilia pinisoli]|uniref:Type II secretion system protein H n=1 Tax=Massilia pinisoli TaxID=1772194 RepID=A0ABT1ZUV9_9BURK|nr:GspH/FimT family pseudopilin [Massilia pinisoli]MCS0583660.1 GspH/FimT family pseudopilin [Massilia pinisoli]